MKTINLNDYKDELSAMIAEGNKRSEEIMNKNVAITKLAREIMGFPGGMICGSKSGYGKQYPKNVAVFNSNVVTAKGKVWYGDFDLTLSENKLVELAKKSGETIYLIYEMDGRFENEESPRLERALYAVTPEGKTTFFEYAKRATHGKLRGKVVSKDRE